VKRAVNIRLNSHRNQHCVDEGFILSSNHPAVEEGFISLPETTRCRGGVYPLKKTSSASSGFSGGDKPRRYNGKCIFRGNRHKKGQRPGMLIKTFAVIASHGQTFQGFPKSRGFTAGDLSFPEMTTEMPYEF
jgi:hypothetical protein